MLRSRWKSRSRAPSWGSVPPRLRPPTDSLTHKDGSMDRTFRRISSLLALAVLCLPATELSAQGIGESLRELGEQNARLYAQPVVSGLGAAMNVGWFHTAAASGFLEVDVGVQVMGAGVPEADETFAPVLPESFTHDGETYTSPYRIRDGRERTPTAVGEIAPVVVEPDGRFRDDLEESGEDPSDYTFTFPEGFDLPAVPAAALQGTVGLGRQTEMTLRWVPSIEFDEEVGSVSSFGVGAKHALDQWFTRPLPVGIAVAAGVQTFDVGDYATADASHVSMIVSKDLASLTLFTAGTLEQSSVEVEYTVENPRLPENQETISFTEDGANGAHLTAGLTLDVYVVRLGATYSVSDYSVLSAGLGVTF